MLNHVVLMGRLTRDPELRNTQSGLTVASFSLAVERDYSQQGEKKQTDFINIVAWRQTADFVCKYFGKGQLAAVSGRLQVREWTDQNGGKRYATEVVAESVYFAEPKRDREQLPATTQYQQAQGQYAPPQPQYQQPQPQQPGRHQTAPQSSQGSQTSPYGQQQTMYATTPNGAAYSTMTPQGQPQGQPMYQAYQTPVQSSSFSELDYDDSDLPF